MHFIVKSSYSLYNVVYCGIICFQIFKQLVLYRPINVIFKNSDYTYVSLNLFIFNYLYTIEVGLYNCMVTFLCCSESTNTMLPNRFNLTQFHTLNNYTKCTYERFTCTLNVLNDDFVYILALKPA